MTISDHELRTRIAEATEDLAIAQRELEIAILELTADTPRAQKTIVSAAVHRALEKVATARSKLSSLTPELPV
jgi:hypothetical protein